MRNVVFAAVVAALAGGGLVAPAGPASAAEDEWDGLPPGPGREDVYYGCNACHSLAIVKQQALNRHRWDTVLVWMVEEQGMPELEPAARERVLDYLAEHFGAD